MKNYYRFQFCMSLLLAAGIAWICYLFLRAVHGTDIIVAAITCGIAAVAAYLFISDAWRELRNHDNTHDNNLSKNSLDYSNSNRGDGCPRG